MTELKEAIYQLRAAVLGRLLQLKGGQVDRPLAELVRDMDDKALIEKIKRGQSKFRWFWKMFD